VRRSGKVLSQSHKQPNKEKDYKMKINHRLLVFTAAAALLAGCATNDRNSGAMGNDTETGVGSDSSVPSATTPAPAPAPNSPTGPNGSIGRGNPFGAGSGSGLQQAN
jgi:hypothetical protein